MEFKKSTRSNQTKNLTAAQKQVQSTLSTFVEERNFLCPGRPACYYMTDESVRELALLPETSLDNILESDPLFLGVLREDVKEREIVASFVYDTLRTSFTFASALNAAPRNPVACAPRFM